MLACLFLEHCAQFDNTKRMTVQSKKPTVVKAPTPHVKVSNGNLHHYSSVYKSLPPTRVSPTYRGHTQVSGRGSLSVVCMMKIVVQFIAIALSNSVLKTMNALGPKYFNSEDGL